MYSRNCRAPWMRRWALTITLAFATLPFPSAVSAGAESSADRVIVIWHKGTSLEHRSQALQAAGGVSFRHFRIVNASAARLPNAKARQLLESNPEVQSIVPDRQLFPGDDLEGWPSKVNCFDCGGGGNPQGQQTPEGVLRIGAAPGTLAFTGRNVGVAMIDTGIYTAHRDFIRADGSNVISPSCFAIASCNQDYDPNGGHGTSVAGVIAAANNSVDVVGVAPDATIFNLEAFDSAGQTFDSYLIQAIEWIFYNNGAVPPIIQVVNMSVGRLGTINDDPALHDAIISLYAHNIVVVVAASNFPTVEVSNVIPAAYPEVIAVASTTAQQGYGDNTGGCSGIPWVPSDAASYFTTDGAFNPTSGIGVTISAPGEARENLLISGASTCGLQSIGITTLKNGGGLINLSGTSFSAPLVTGVVALLKEQAGYPGTSLTPEATRTRIRSSAYRVGVAPLDSLSSQYTFDGEREGIVSAPGALQ